jgi:hypothetical protein
MFIYVTRGPSVVQLSSMLWYCAVMWGVLFDELLFRGLVGTVGIDRKIAVVVLGLLLRK